MYTELKASGRFMEASELKSVNKAISDISSEVTTADMQVTLISSSSGTHCISLQEEISALENEIASLTNRIDDLVFQRDTFAIRLQKMGERSSSLKQYHLKFDDPGLSTQLVARGSGGAAVTAATALNAQLNKVVAVVLILSPVALI